jgi:hypothetical protein
MADTGGEHRHTYERVEMMREYCANNGVTLLECAADTTLPGDIFRLGSGINRLDQPPFYIDKGSSRGRLPSRCTRYYKIAPMRRAVSAWLKEQGLPKKVIKWIGFGADEGRRVTKTVGKRDVKWELLDFPLVRQGWSRQRIDAWFDVSGLGRPGFSMCTFCPHKGPQRWDGLHPDDYAQAIAVDDEIGATAGPGYVSGSLIPVKALLSAIGRTDETELDDDTRERAREYFGLDKGDEITGCDSGHCFL